MLNDRLDECVATLDRERMAIEIIFRLKENGEDYLFWMSVRGADGAGLDPDNALDRDHVDQAKRTIEPGNWTEAEPQVLLLPIRSGRPSFLGRCAAGEQAKKLATPRTGTKSRRPPGTRAPTVAGYPGRGGGLWLWMVLPSGLVIWLVPSGWTVSFQPSSCISTWWCHQQ